ncbi:MAG: NTP transferase domain-containing protein [Geminicoccaceae bacterium]|nr:NTP transferase domain-containing protein [Geminicoccaceae bacterium]
MTPSQPVAALVLAGARPGEVDPVARAAGVPFKCLAPIAGRPMVERVVEALVELPTVARIVVVADPAARLDELPAIARLRSGGRLALRSPEPGLAASVEAGLAHTEGLPLLVTTADHPLLDRAILETFLGAALASGAALAVGVAPEPAVRAVAPSTRRTWWRFRDGRFSGANLFLLRGEAAHPVLAFWRRVEAERKRPWRIVRLFGPSNLVLYASRLLTLEAAMARASRILGCRVAAVSIPIGTAAIDVDRPADLALAEAILAGRPVAGSPS